MDEGRKALMRNLIKQVSQMSETERQAIVARMPVVNTEGRVLSINNVCLIYQQILNLPRAVGDITIVGGFKQWLKQGRCVRKGEHGFTIWFPVKPKSENDDENDGDENISKFLFGTVFDISQTCELTN